MNFTSQICTTKEQSERLMDLGLKRGTADMCYQIRYLDFGGVVTMTAENPDIWATNGYHTTLVEVKTSHADFLADKKKWIRSEEAEIADKCLGNFRYYLCPEGVISENEIPDKWGLLVYNRGRITKVKSAKYQKSSTDAELLVMSSIMRRCGIKPQIFNFRQTL